MRTLFPKKSGRADALLNPGAGPRQLTLTWEDRFADGGVDDGIYELDGDRLKVCFAPRSTSFTVARGDRGVTLLVLKRDR